MGERRALSRAGDQVYFFFLSPRRIDALYLPRFSVSGDYQLEDTLKQLGIQKVFTHEADLSGVTGDNKLGVSKVSF